jgi:predicted transport protein
VESYVFRRAVCGIPTNSHNKTFATFAASLRKERYLESIEASFLTMPSYRRFPSNEEFEQDIQTRDLYNFRSRNTYWLRRLENHDRKERVFVEEYTVEHIMPQNENLSPAWQRALGPDWRRVHETWLHRLGNLTLTGYNAEYSDRTFSEKRDMPGGMGKSPLHLNAGLGDIEAWNEQTILGRGQQLAKLAREVWPLPSLDAAVLQKYSRMASADAVYSISDHPYLAGGATRLLFEALRKQVLALDANITEEFLAHYVAYKAETNFVDVTPLARSLKLTLNLPFPEVEDPHGMCRDVSGIGHWGNGDVELIFSAIDQLLYIVGLVRQSFERQMATGADA